MRKTSEILIVGGGVIGAAAAYYLSKKGYGVTVLEKNEIACGGSGRNGGGVRQSGRDPREIPLAMYGVENLWPDLSDVLGMDIEYYKKGNLRLAKNENHLKILQDLTRHAREKGLVVDMIDGKAVKEICPHLSKEVVGASWCPTDGHANPMLTTLAYYKNARQQGAVFITGEEVIEIKKVRGVAQKVITKTATYEADIIILAAGYESRALANQLGIDVPMQRILREALVTETQPKMFEQMLGTAEADFYGHQTTHGSFVFGGTSGLEAFQSEVESPNNNSKTAPCICRGIMKYFPALSEAKIVRTWAGWTDDCADHVPVLSFVEEVPHLILACGFSGHGFGIAPVVGILLSEMAVGETTRLSIEAFKYDRFEAKI